MPCPYPLLGLEQPPCEGVTAAPQASWPGPATSPSNTPVPTTAGARGWRRYSPKDSAHLLSPGSMLPAPGSPPGFGLTPSLLILMTGKRVLPTFSASLVCGSRSPTSWCSPLPAPQHAAAPESHFYPLVSPEGASREMFCLERLCNFCASLKLLCTEL